MKGFGNCLKEYLKQPCFDLRDSDNRRQIMVAPRLNLGNVGPDQLTGEARINCCSKLPLAFIDVSYWKSVK